jgi:hypothetical protein
MVSDGQARRTVSAHQPHSADTGRAALCGPTPGRSRRLPALSPSGTLAPPFLT